MNDDAKELSASEPATGALSLRGASSVARMRALLDRPLPPEEIRENTALVAARAEAAAGATRSLLVFAVGAERLAVDAGAAHRVVPASTIRRVPHRSNAVLAGIASVGGELTLVARIGAALGVAAAERQTHFIVIGAAGARWAFGADAVEGVRRVSESTLLAPPTTVRHAIDGCASHVFKPGAPGEAGLVTVLDAARLVALFARSLA